MRLYLCPDTVLALLSQHHVAGFVAAAADCSFLEDAPSAESGLPLGALLSTAPGEMADDPTVRLATTATSCKPRSVGVAGAGSKL